MDDDRPATLGALLKISRLRLAAAGVEDPALEARLLVEHYTGASWTDMIARPEQAVAGAAAEATLEAVARREAGMPVHRILGHRMFYGLKLSLSPQTLEPRPDTETLVELALPEARRIAAKQGSCRILDLGTGTGAIALALIGQVAEADALGVDISEDALATARANADMNGLGWRFGTLKSDVFAEVEGCFDLIVSNPPYIPTAVLETLSREVREHDPRIALDGGPDGLDFYRRIAEGAGRHLAPEGAIAVETGHDQARAVRDIFASRGLHTARMARDLGGHDRALLVRAARPIQGMEKTLGKMPECR